MKGLWKLVLMQVVGTAALLWLGYAWLGVGEASAGMLGLSVVMLLALISGVLLLQGTSLVYFRESQRSVGGAVLRVVKRLPVLLLIAVAAGAVYLGLWLWDPKGLVLSIASGLTLLTQTPVRPAWILRVVETIVMIVRWWVLPVVLVPLVAGVAMNGLRGLGEYRAQLRNWKYWVITPVVFGLGVWLPLWLLTWKPVQGAFNAELTSFALRYGAAYLLFVAAFLVLAFATSRGRPVLSQESTTGSV